MKICLVGYDLRSLYGEPLGGSEWQTALLAHYLAQRGHHVTFVVVGYGGPELTIEGVRVCSGWLPGHGIRGIRYLTYRLPTLRRTLQEIAADAYYTMGAAFFTSTVIKSARSVGAVALLGLASDRDLFADSARAHFEVGNSYLTTAIAPFAYQLLYVPSLRTADCIIVQNLDQKARCADLRLPHRLIPSIVEAPPVDLLTPREDLDVVWAGNVPNSFGQSKGFGDLVRLIKLMPDMRFGIVGRQGPASLSEQIQELRRHKEIHLFGPLSHAETLRVISQSKVVINTSPSEGFSNVLLEGWSLCKPAVTLRVNPNNLLRDGGLGLCAQGDLLKMTAMIRSYVEDDVERQSAGTRCRQYVEEYHSPDVVCQQYESLVSSRS